MDEPEMGSSILLCSGGHREDGGDTIGNTQGVCGLPCSG